jgi:hypothetical protein
MTFVSIKYTRRLGGGVHPFEVGIGANVRHRGQDLRKRTHAWASQRRSQDCPVLSLGAVPVFTGAPLQRSDDGFINSPNQQIGHDALPRSN